MFGLGASTPVLGDGTIETTSPRTLSCELQVASGADAVVAHLGCRNEGADGFHLLRYNFPVDGELTRSLFDIRRGGRAVRYLGRMIKRPAPRQGDFLRLAPGESVSTSIVLSRYYALSAHGRYTIRYYCLNPSLHADSLDTLSSNTMHLIR